MVRRSSMLKRTSRFVLEVLPFLLSVLIAAVLVPGVLYSRAHGLETGVGQDISASQKASPSVRHNDAVLPAGAAASKLGYR